MFSIEDFVPADHLLRKIDSAVDFIHIYDLVEDLYCKDNGRPSVDPVVIFKMVLIQHIYGIPSLRRTVEEIKMNVAYRWFLGYLMNEEIPHFSTISYNFKHRYTEKTIEGIFYWILNEIERAGYLSPETVFIDGTHIKANANIKKVVKKAVPQAAKRYEEELIAEIAAAAVLNETGIETSGTFRNSTAYIQNWRDAIKADNKLVVHASSKAQKAFEMIMGLETEKK